MLYQLHDMVLMIHILVIDRVQAVTWPDTTDDYWFWQVEHEKQAH